MGAAAGCDELRSSFHPREWEADMRKLFLAIIGLVTAFGIASAGAQSYPSRPITLIVPFAAGGPADALARALVEGVGASLGQTVIIEHAPGASVPIGLA